MRAYLKKGVYRGLQSLKDFESVVTDAVFYYYRFRRGRNAEVVKNL
jgi:hypothetical protein